MKKISWINQCIHLIISSVIIIPIAFIYGFSPTTLLPKHLNIIVETIDLSNLLRAIMCLYLGMSFVWILGILNPKYWKAATQLNFLFMATLACGRIMSMLIDGIPSGGYIFGVIAELILAALALWQLKKYSNNPI